MLRAASAVDDFEESGSTGDPLDEVTEAAARGDTRAIQVLIVSVSPILLRAVVGVLGGDHPEIEDVVQESAFGLVAALKGFRRECRVQHFAVRIAIWTALKARRRLESRNDAHTRLASSGDPQYQDASPGQVAHDLRRRQVLRSLFEELPDAQSEALVMHVALDLKVWEVAAATGAPVNTVRSRLRLAKAALRLRIESEPALRDALEVLP